MGNTTTIIYNLRDFACEITGHKFRAKKGPLFNMSPFTTISTDVSLSHFQSISRHEESQLTIGYNATTNFIYKHHCVHI